MLIILSSLDQKRAETASLSRDEDRPLTPHRTDDGNNEVLGVHLARAVPTGVSTLEQRVDQPINSVNRGFLSYLPVAKGASKFLKSSSPFYLKSGELEGTLDTVVTFVDQDAGPDDAQRGLWHILNPNDPAEVNDFLNKPELKEMKRPYVLISLPEYKPDPKPPKSYAHKELKKIFGPLNIGRRPKKSTSGSFIVSAEREPDLGETIPTPGQ